MIRVIMGMVSQRRFHVHIGKSKSRCRTLLNGVLQGSVIAPALYNIPTTVYKRKYMYADEILVMESDKCFTVVKQTLTI